MFAYTKDNQNRKSAEKKENTSYTVKQSEKAGAINTWPMTSAQPVQLRSLFELPTTLDMYIEPKEAVQSSSAVIQRFAWNDPASVGHAFITANPFPATLNEIEANQFRNTIGVQGATKLACLQQMAAFIAGLNVPPLRNIRNTGSQVNSGIDPFTVRVNGTYGPDATALSLIYRFAKNGYGYIVQIIDAEEEYQMNENRGQGVVLEANQYASAHDTDPGRGNTSMPDLMGLGGADLHVALDAVTKVAGEGARFQCVRENAATITNNTVIYTQHAGANIGVPFNVLWGKWKDWFNSEFNIGNARISQVLIANSNVLPAVPANGILVN